VIRLKKILILLFVGIVVAFGILLTCVLRQNSIMGEETDSIALDFESVPQNKEFEYIDIYEDNQEELKQIYENTKCKKGIAYSIKEDMNGDGIDDDIKVIGEVMASYSDVNMCYSSYLKICKVIINEYEKNEDYTVAMPEFMIVSENGVKRLRILNTYRDTYGSDYMYINNEIITEKCRLMQLDMVKDFEIDIIGNVVSINSYFGTGKEAIIIVPSTVSKYEVTKIRNNAFSDCNGNYVLIPDSVTEIEPEAIPKSVGIIANKNSYAYEYAKSNNLDVVTDEKEVWLLNNANANDIDSVTLEEIVNEKAEIDLDGDGMPEKIEHSDWEWTDGELTGGYISINGTKYDDYNLIGNCSGIKIVDLNSKDKYKEIFICLGGTSSTTDFAFFSYKKDELKCIYKWIEPVNGIYFLNNRCYLGKPILNSSISPNVALEYFYIFDGELYNYRNENIIDYVFSWNNADEYFSMYAYESYFMMDSKILTEATIEELNDGYSLATEGDFDSVCIKDSFSKYLIKECNFKFDSKDINFSNTIKVKLNDGREAFIVKLDSWV